MRIQGKDESGNVGKKKREWGEEGREGKQAEIV